MFEIICNKLSNLSMVQLRFSVWNCIFKSQMNQWNEMNWNLECILIQWIEDKMHASEQSFLKWPFIDQNFLIEAGSGNNWEPHTKFTNFIPRKKNHEYQLIFMHIEMPVIWREPPGNPNQSLTCHTCSMTCFEKVYVTENRIWCLLKIHLSIVAAFEIII